MTRIYLIRHAEAEGNLYRRAQGHYDSNLTELGRRQLAALAKRFADIPVDALWSSDLRRAQSTAAAVLKHHPALALRTTAALREIDVGIWEDRPWGEIEDDYPEQMAYFRNDPALWSVTGSEDYGRMIERMRRAVLELAADCEGGTVAAVSHGLAIRSLLCDLMGVPSREINTVPYGDNTAVALLEVRGERIEMRWYNDASHLESAERELCRRVPVRQSPYGRFSPLRLPAESELYSRCYADTWRASHGTTEGFAPVMYLRAAQRHAEQDARCLVKISSDGEFAGIIELDPERGREDNAGWVSLIYIEPKARGRHLGAQLIGHASSYFRHAGRGALRLHVSVTNEAALGFYRSLGFRELGRTLGVGGALSLMQLDIAPRVLTAADI